MLWLLFLGSHWMLASTVAHSTHTYIWPPIMNLTFDSVDKWVVTNLLSNQIWSVRKLPGQLWLDRVIYDGITIDNKLIMPIGGDQLGAILTSSLPPHSQIYYFQTMIHGQWIMDTFPTCPLTMTTLVSSLVYADRLWLISELNLSLSWLYNHLSASHSVCAFCLSQILPCILFWSMYSISHSIAHLAPHAAWTRVCSQLYNSIPSTSITTSLSSPLTKYLNTPPASSASSVSSLKSNPSGQPPLKQISQTIKDTSVRDISKNKFALGLVGV